MNTNQIAANVVYENLQTALAEMHAAELAEERHNKHHISAIDARTKYENLYRETVTNSTNPIIVTDRNA